MLIDRNNFILEIASYFLEWRRWTQIVTLATTLTDVFKNTASGIPYIFQNALVVNVLIYAYALIVE